MKGNDIVVGTFPQGIITVKDGERKKSKTEEAETTFEFIELVNAPRRDFQRKSLTKKRSITFNSQNSFHLPDPKDVIHASIQYLDRFNSNEKDALSYQIISSLSCFGFGNISGSRSRFSLLAVVWKERSADERVYYSSSVSLLHETTYNVPEVTTSGETGAGDDISPKTDIKKVAELMLVNKFEREFHAHLLTPHKRPADEESDIDTTGDSKISSFKNRIVILNLDEIIQFTIETFPHEHREYARISLLDSEMIARCFWWAQWVPQYQFLAFAHDRKIQQYTFDEEEVPQVTVKPMLSVLQFHNDFPRESVLNMPLDINSETTTGNSPLGKLVLDPNIIKSKPVSLKLCAQASGAVYVFWVKNPDRSLSTDHKTASCQKNPNVKLIYSINLLHHNKTLNVEYDLKDVPSTDLPLKMDVATFANDQYLAVIGWPVFVHLLDVGITHEPSHHITLDINSFSLLSQQVISLPAQLPQTFLLILQSDNNPSAAGTNKFLTGTNNADDKLSVFAINLVKEDLSFSQVVLAPAKLHQLMEKKPFSIREKLALIHYILVHVGDVNVCKRIIYDEGKKMGNLNLTKLYQEFIVGAAYSQTKKQLLPNMEQFLNFIPYSPHSTTDYNGKRENPSFELSTNWTEVGTMLLSPSQRVFPHNITDVWTSLWHMNKQLTKSNRFSHKSVADKLLLALQCYKPEALSKASTPMSPSSPMVCASLGDIAGLFGRRATELQLPFVEHESCTANKQEYIFSINLRELSMHLLKERKEYPLLGHTVAGKYVSALVDTARLLCHLACLTVHLQPTKNRDKGFRLIDCLEWETKLRLFMLLEHYALALGTLACPLPQGFTPFFAYLAYKTLNFDKFIWHVRNGTFELQIDLVKTIMADLKDSDQESVSRKLQLLSLLPKSRAYRILNSWSHPVSISLRARQHSCDLLSGTASQGRKSTVVSLKKKKANFDTFPGKTNITALDSFFQLLTGKASAADIDLGLLTEATMLSMQQQQQQQRN